MGSDFAVGYELFEKRDQPGKESYWYYGLFVFAINWVPGIAAAIHCISMYRHQLKPKITIIYAALLIVLYPIVPTMAYIVLLWTHPKVKFIKVFYFL